MGSPASSGAELFTPPQRGPASQFYCQHLLKATAPVTVIYLWVLDLSITLLQATLNRGFR